MSKIYTTCRGTGSTIILLHGFPFNHLLWDDFAPELARNFKVFTPDLPGFGKSEILPGAFTIDNVATRLLEWMEENDEQEVTLIGHSLGGYVALGMVEQRPEWFTGLGLFHSTAYADNEEKKASRTKVLKFVDEKGVKSFTSNFIEPLFADPHHPAIEKVKDISVQASAEAVKGYTMAMRDRPDRTEVISNFKGDILYIAGEEDAGIPVDSVKKQALLNKSSQVHIFPDTGHMGMFEKTFETLTVIKSFCRK